MLAALRAGWWLPLLGLLVGGGAALGASLLQTPLYTSSTQFFITATTDSTASQILQGSQFSAQRAHAYAQLIPGEDLATQLIDRLHLDLSPGELESRIKATAAADTGLIDVSVTDPSAKQAKSIADAIDAEFGPFVTDLETPTAGGTSPVKVTVTDRPEVAGAPSSPDTTRNVAAGAVLGLLAGAALAVARVRPEPTVSDAEQAAELVGAPVIGHVVRDDALAKGEVVSRTGAGLAVENYRQLRNNLQWLDVDNPPSVIMVTSAVPAEGKTMTVLNLGLVLADAGRRVTIVDADLRSPKVIHYLGMADGAGLSNVLGGSADLAEVMQRVRRPGPLGHSGGAGRGQPGRAPRLRPDGVARQEAAWRQRLRPRRFSTDASCRRRVRAGHPYGRCAALRPPRRHPRRTASRGRSACSDR